VTALSLMARARKKEGYSVTVRRSPKRSAESGDYPIIGGPDNCPGNLAEKPVFYTTIFAATGSPQGNSAL